MSDLTVMQVERAMKTLAYIISFHKLPAALPNLKRLEAERDRLLEQDYAMAYAANVLFDLGCN